MAFFRPYNLTVVHKFQIVLSFIEADNEKFSCEADYGCFLTKLEAHGHSLQTDTFMKILSNFLTSMIL